MDRLPNEILWVLALHIEAWGPTAQVTFGRLRLCHRNLYALFSQFYYSSLTIPICKGDHTCNDTCISRISRVVQRLHENPETADFVKHLKVACWRRSPYTPSIRTLNTVVRFDSELLMPAVQGLCMYPEEGKAWTRDLVKGDLDAWIALLLPVMTGLSSIELGYPTDWIWVFKMVGRLTRGLLPPKYKGALAQLRYACVHINNPETIDHYKSHLRYRRQLWDVSEDLWFNIPSMRRVWAYYRDVDAEGRPERAITEMKLSRDWIETQRLNPADYSEMGTVLERLARQEAFGISGEITSIWHKNKWYRL